jgi:hypothetical protein
MFSDRLLGVLDMGKAAENERIKLKATFFNNVSVGLTVTGVFVPYLAFLQSGQLNSQVVHDFLAGNISQYWLLPVKLFVMFLAFGSAAIFRHGASTEIAKLQD